MIDNKITHWWNSALGQAVLEQEKTTLQSYSHYFYGYYQLQLGLKSSLFPKTPQAHQQTIMADSADIEACNEALPFKAYSLDLVLLGHVLEFSDDPHQVLREVERILVADGIVILCCFNPWSLWGLKRLFSWQDQAPWQGYFFRQSRIKDWLSLLNFNIINTEQILFRPPIKSKKWFNKFQFMEQWGQRIWRPFSAVKIIIAQKQTMPLTPIHQQAWHSKNLFSGTVIPRPATRGTFKR